MISASAEWGSDVLDLVVGADLSVRGFLLGEVSMVVISLVLDWVASCSSLLRFFEDLCSDLSFDFLCFVALGVSITASTDIIRACQLFLSQCSCRRSWRTSKES